MGMELKDYLRIARRRWLMISLITLAAIAVSTVLTLRATPQYSSTSRLFISTSEAGSTEAYQGGLFSQQRVKSYADLLTGEEISRRVVDSLNLDLVPRQLASRITAVAQPDTVVLAITVTDTDPDEAQRLGQAVAEEFVTYVSELEAVSDKEKAPVKATIVDRATAPSGPVSPQPRRSFMLAAFLGLLLGAGAALLRETLDTSISSPEELTDAANGAPLLGSINFDKDAPARPLVTDLSSHAPRVEAFRVLRTNMQFINVDGNSKVFVITSAVPGEGKSTTICNLAITLAQSGEKVVLVEADLRRPKAADYLHLEGSVGVTTVLTGRIGMEGALQHGPEGLQLIAAGSTPPNPAELLQSDAMKKLIAKLREQFDIVLIDAPPLLPVTDAAILAAEADGAILIVRHGKTTHDQVAGAVGRLESVDAKLLGTVANMTPAAKRGKYGYGYGYGYGYAPEVGRSKKNLKAEKKPKRKVRASKQAQAEKPATPSKVEQPAIRDNSGREPANVHWYKPE